MAAIRAQEGVRTETPGLVLHGVRLVRRVAHVARADVVAVADPVDGRLAVADAVGGRAPGRP